MIADTLNNSDSYTALGERIATALEFLKKTDFSQIPDGRIEIRGDEIFAMLQHYTTKPLEQGKWEAHHKYIDIQFLAEGTELIGIHNVANLEITEPYSNDNDVMFLDGNGGDFITLANDKFVLLFPQDAHMPCITDKNDSNVTKIVVKILT
jgi:YhcH/YjgK/YiaL family protein